MSVNQQRGVIRHQWKFKQHLIDFAVAVAADGHDLFLSAVELFDHLRRRIVRAQGIARAVVQGVAEQHEQVGGVGFDMTFQQFKALGGAVYIREKKQFHD